MLGLKDRGKKVGPELDPSMATTTETGSLASNTRSRGSSTRSTASNLLQDVKSGSKDGSGQVENTLASIQFLGYAITSKVGLNVYKSVSIILPLLPTFALIVHNALELNDMVRASQTLDKNFAQQVSANSLSVLASKLQDERYNAIFDILMSKYVPSKALT